MARVVCVANSIRHDGRCFAGIDMDTGEWVRPVPAKGGCGLSYSDVCVNGQPVALLDILEIDMTTRNPGTKYQCENRVMRAKAWKQVGRLKPSALLKYCDDSSPILHSTTDRVKPADLDAMSPDDWVSLRLVRPSKVHFARDYFKRSRWRASFADAKKNYYDLKVTDPVVSGRLNHDEKVGSDCILTVSMTEPWSPDSEKAAMCWKLVAAVIEL